MVQIALRASPARQVEDMRAGQCGGLFPLTPCLRRSRRGRQAAFSLGESMCLASGRDWSVAQIFNLPYRRIVFGRVSDWSHAPEFPTAWQSATLRYGRVQLCATKER